MRFFSVALVFSLGVVTILAASNDECLDGLQRCYDYNYYAMERKIKDQQFHDACGIYSGALHCMNTLPCEKTNSYNKKQKQLKKKLLDEVEGICNPDGEIDDCFYKLVECENTFMKVDKDLKETGSKACLELATFDKCTKNAKFQCPERALADILSEWEPLNKDAHRAGCDVSCTDALQECTAELKVADSTSKEEMCLSIDFTKKCLERTQTNIGCSSKDSQKYLKEAIAAKHSQYASDCDGVPPSVQVSLLLMLSAIAASVFSQRFFQ